MLFGNRGPRTVATGRREPYQPKLQALEDRLLLSIDLGGVLAPASPNIATQPYGVQLAGEQSAGAAGFSVTDVGDVNGDGLDDFVIGAPTGQNINGQIQPGTGSNARTYLVFGSNQVNSANVADWANTATMTAGMRVGNLSQLGTSPQTNPITGQPGFAYNGATFLTGTTQNSQLGASVTALGDLNGDGLADFLIGAPNALDGNGLNQGTGRAYLVFGSKTAFNGTTIDLDNPSATAGLSVITFTSTIINSHVGRAVAGLGSFLATGSAASDVAIAAPDASIAGLTDNGAVYVIPGTVLAGLGNTTLSLNTVGQGGGLGGVVFAGATASEEIGLSVAGAGNVNGALSNVNQSIDDMLIGAPNSNSGAGQAWLIYGGSNIPGQATVVSGSNVILTNRIGGTATTSVSGADFLGPAGGRAGFAVAGMGDYNGDGNGDIAIGSPFATTNSLVNSGEVDLFYGQPQSGSTLTGTIQLGAVPTSVPSLTLTGATSNALAGYSLSLSGAVTASEHGNDMLVGSPGLNGDFGGVYFFPANPFFLTGTFQLSNAETQPLAGTLIQISTTPNNIAPFLGASVSGLLVPTGAKNTADVDNQADFIIGAPNYGVTGSGTAGDGAAFIIEGKFLPVTPPVNTAIQTQIGVGQPFAPFIINASNPAALSIYVFSNNTISPPFQPVTQIDPTTIVVNGVPYANATIATDPVDENKDGIPDAIITITPRSRMNLQTTSTTLTITGKTLASSPQGGKSFSGTAPITVSGGVTPPINVITGGASAIQVGAIIPTSFTPHFGAGVFVPPISALSAYDYKPVPFSVAYQQYVPNPGFALRMKEFQHPTHLSRVSGRQNSLVGQLSLTVPKSAFTRSKYHGKTNPIAVHHEKPVIPVQRQDEVLLRRPKVKGNPPN